MPEQRLSAVEDGLGRRVDAGGRLGVGGGLGEAVVHLLVPSEVVCPRSVPHQVRRCPREGLVGSL